MYENVIEATRREIVRLINEQKQDLLQRLVSTPDLLKSQRQDKQQRSLDREEVEQWIKILDEEAYKVERLEMTFAVVGTMKAGKSTTINAIVGTEVLPNRNQPMTTIPTVIRHCSGTTEPELKFPNPKPFNELVAMLKKKLSSKKIACQIQNSAFCAADDGKELIQKIVDGSLDTVKTTHTGPEEIFSFLKLTNDIIRLCNDDSIAFDMEMYLSEYDRIDKFPSIEVEFFHLRGQSNTQIQGKFTLLDTPGPNEAGQHHLKQIMQEQLEKASAVLAVLDYTQLNAEADAEVRNALDEIAAITKDRLFILVNKFDQKDRNGMDSEELKQYVVQNLFEGNMASDRVYPVSSKYGYLANRALNELNLFGRLPDHKQFPWVEDFGRLALGTGWEDDISDLVEVKSRAQKLWKNSLFDSPLNDVIIKGAQNAALISLKSAVSKMAEFDKKVVDGLSLRQKAINLDLAVIEQHIKSLETDIELISVTRENARSSVKRNISQLETAIKQYFNTSINNADIAVEKIFKEGKIKEKEAEKQKTPMNSTKPEIRLVSILSAFLGHSSNSIKPGDIVFDPKGPNRFSSESEATDFLANLLNTIVQIIDPMFVEIKQKTQYTVEQTEKEFWPQIEKQLGTILQTAQERLNEAFSVSLEFPKPQINSINFDFERLQDHAIKEKSITETGTKYERRWYTLYLVKHAVEYSYEAKVYDVYTKEVGIQLRKSITEIQNNLLSSINTYINTELNNTVETYFGNLTSYLERFRGDLLDSVQDKKMEGEHLDKLQKAMSSLREVAEVHRQDVESIEVGIHVNESTKS